MGRRRCRWNFIHGVTTKLVQGWPPRAYTFVRHGGFEYLDFKAMATERGRRDVDIIGRRLNVVVLMGVL